MNNLSLVLDDTINKNNKIKYMPRNILTENIKLRTSEILQKYEIIEYNSKEIPEFYFEKLLSVANNWFGIEMDLEDVKNHLFKAEKVFFLKINDEIIWFSSLSSLKNFTYRFWTVIKKKYQANWLYQRLSKAILKDNEKYFLRTQNKNVIKSLRKSFDVVLYWKEALEHLVKSEISINKINDFMISVWDKEKTLDNNWIFREIYGWKMWDEDRVNYIDWDFTEGFDTEKWDSLLVVYFNNKK